MPKNRRVYNISSSKMLLTSKTISESFSHYLDQLSHLRANWTPEYAEDLKNRIDYAIDNYMELDERRKLREATNHLYALQGQAISDLSSFRTQLKIDFRDEAGEYLNDLGFNKHANSALRLRSQEALIELLVRFKMAMNKKMKEKICSKGMNTELIDRIISFSDKIKEANTRQEVHKGKYRKLYQESNRVFDDIYSEVIGICKIVRNSFPSESPLHNHFIFKKVLNNMSKAESDTGHQLSESIKK